MRSTLLFLVGAVTLVGCTTDPKSAPDSGPDAPSDASDAADVSDGYVADTYVSDAPTFCSGALLPDANYITACARTSMTGTTTLNALCDPGDAAGGDDLCQTAIGMATGTTFVRGGETYLILADQSDAGDYCAYFEVELLSDAGTQLCRAADCTCPGG